MTFAGLRYTLAFFILLPGMWKHKVQIRSLSKKEWKRLTILGLIFYTMTQGGQFLTLNHLEAVTFSLLLNFTSILVAFFGIVALREIPSRMQWTGIIIFMVGVLIYFFPASGSGGNILGLILAGLTICANAIASVFGRAVNREKAIPPLIVTAISMGVGAFSLLVIGLSVHGFPCISPKGWVIIIWLAVINTALAFTLWNQSLQKLSAVESSIINNTMLIQIAVFAWLFLDESLTSQGVIGLTLAATGILITNLKSA